MSWVDRLFVINPAGWSNMRQHRLGKPSSDEDRLFPSYRKSNDDVPIKPGQTFENNRAKARVQKYGFRPVDRITPRAKASGPVRACGKSNENGHSHHSPPPPLSSPTLVDNENRAMKRRRHSSGQVIDLEVEDDEIPASSSRQQARRSHRNATPPTEIIQPMEDKLSKRDSSQLFHAPENDKYEVEIKLNRTGLRNENAVSKRGKSTNELVNKRPNSILDLDVDGHDTLHLAEETRRDKTVAHQTLSNKKEWNSDSSESPDELQLGTAAQAYPSRPKNKLVHARNEKIVKRMNPRLSPSDIQPTFFNSPNKKQTKMKQLAKSHRQLFELKIFRYGDVEIKDRSMNLFLDEGNKTFGLLGAEQHLPSENISLQRVIQVIQGTDGSLKCRFKLAKVSDTVNQDLADIEFANEEDKSRLFALFRKKNIPFLEKPKEWMDKAFDIVMKFEPRRAKRPSSEVITTEVSDDGQPEPVKRLKLSEMLQGEDEISKGIKQPPRRVPLPGTQMERPSHGQLNRNDKGASIPVKRYEASYKDRETRSKTRQSLVDLIDNESATTVRNENASSRSGTWSTPLVYPREGKKKAEVDSNDLERLRDGEFLNDNLIGLYLRFLEHHLERKNPEVARRIYFFNSYLFATLTNTPKGKKGVNYEGVQKWTRNIDLFDHDYVIVPINENAHWYLAIICNLTSLKKKEKRGCDSSQENVVHNQLVEKEEIPETPPPEKASESEESARDSLASMRIGDIKTTRNSQAICESDDEWPEKDENQTTPSTIFQKQKPSEASDPNIAKNDSKKAKKTKRVGQVYSVDQPIIITFDSLGLTRQPAIKVLRSYLLEEAVAKHSLELESKDIKGMTAKEIPLQPNYSDCGLYLLAYLEKFAQDPDIFVEKLLLKEMSAKEDWPALKSGLLRRRLRDFLFKLHEEQDASQDNGLVNIQPVSHLLGPPTTPPPAKEEKSASPDPEAVPDSVREEIGLSDDQGLTYDSAGEAIVQETQLSQAEEASGTQSAGRQQQKKAAIQPKASELEPTTEFVTAPNHLAGLAEAAASPSPGQHENPSKDIFEDMLEFLSQEEGVPRNNVEIQIPTIQVPRTPPSAGKKAGKKRVIPKQSKSKKMVLKDGSEPSG